MVNDNTLLSGLDQSNGNLPLVEDPVVWLGNDMDENRNGYYNGDLPNWEQLDSLVSTTM